MGKPARSLGWRIAELNRDTLQRIADLVMRDTGIVLGNEKASLVQARLMRRLRATRIPDFESYLRFVDSVAGADERKNMLRALTTNVTRFYREPHHFEDLRLNVLPALAARVRDGGRLRIWSSACSTGEEPYSIAMEVCAFFPDIARYDVKILATDIDTDVLQRACTGTYAGHAIAGLPAARRQFFPSYSDARADHLSGDYRISDAARRIVSFRVLNLLKDWPFRGPFDAIFCRNVLIYFGRETQERLFERFAAASAKGSRLYIGHSERIVGRAQSSYRSVGTTTYCREQ